MKTYLWCSVHTPTAEQVNELGDVIMLKDIDNALQTRLNNTSCDTSSLYELGRDLLLLATSKGAKIVQPGGSPAFQCILGRICQEYNIVVVYAHSERVSVDVPQSNGSVIKTSVFKHVKFFEV